MDCQLGKLPQAGSELTRGDRAGRSLRRLSGFLSRGTSKVARDPGLLARKARGLRGTRSSNGCQAVARESSARLRLRRLDLREGERVRVKTWNEISATLDAEERFEGLAWMSLMRPFCEKQFTVTRRVDRFFDERSRRLLKLRDVVLLDGVYCQPPADSPVDYAGCQRMCFLFWKEAWLERVSSGH